jgi:hypothetical protein
VADIKKFFEEAKRRYTVNDLQNPSSRILFILESPHKEEIKFDVPLAGLSGKSMAKELFKRTDILPMGKYLKELEKEKVSSVYGIVNVSPFPLQKSAYPDAGFAAKYAEELQIAEAVRVSGAKYFKDPDKELFHSLLVQDLEHRLNDYLTKETVLVPCGKFAEKYIKETRLEHDSKVIWGVPHPSYNSWARTRYQEVIQQVRDEGVKKTS